MSSLSVRFMINSAVRIWEWTVYLAATGAIRLQSFFSPAIRRDCSLLLCRLACCRVLPLYRRPAAQVDHDRPPAAAADLRLPAFNPDLELSLSTRESPYFRDHLVGLGITTMSAGSHSQPCGYSEATNSALEQFAVSDERTSAEVAEAVARRGYQLVWKDWDAVYG